MRNSYASGKRKTLTMTIYYQVVVKWKRPSNSTPPPLLDLIHHVIAVINSDSKAALHCDYSRSTPDLNCIFPPPLKKAAATGQWMLPWPKVDGSVKRALNACVVSSSLRRKESVSRTSESVRRVVRVWTFPRCIRAISAIAAIVHGPVQALPSQKANCGGIKGAESGSSG